jgi:PAS domain S-box-containing protein
MPDGLTNEERAFAWLASWHPSFSGTAIVNPNFTFRAVNYQFCKILGVTPAELIDHKFTDLTPEPIKSLDLQNANLVKQKKITSYLMDKVYQFPDGKRVEVTLLVKGVYHPKTHQFLFFVSSIMGKDMPVLAVKSPSQTLIELFFTDKKKFITTFITGVALAIAYLLDKAFNLTN